MLLLYRSVRWVNSIYPVAVFFTYITIALATFAVCFLMPVIGVLSLVFSLLSLVPIVFAWRLLQAGERWLVRDSIRRRRCPSCGEELPGEDAIDCFTCGAAFDVRGERVVA